MRAHKESTQGNATAQRVQVDCCHSWSYCRRLLFGYMIVYARCEICKTWWTIKEVLEELQVESPRDQNARLAELIAETLMSSGVFDIVGDNIESRRRVSIEALIRSVLDATELPEVSQR
jgi:hypothetical protein